MTDGDFLAPVRALAATDVTELQELLSEIEALDTFTEPGSTWVAYVEPVDRLMSWLYRCRLVVPFDWAAWDEGRGLGPSDIASRPVEDAVRMLTAIIRNERFCEGAFGSALSAGIVQACLRRVLVAS